MDNAQILDALAECEALTQKVAEPMRNTAFGILLQYRLYAATPTVVPVAQAARSVPVPTKSANVADLMRQARTAREKLIVAIGEADGLGAGILLSTIRETLLKFRQPLPKNISRDVSDLIKAGVVIPLQGKGRDATYGLSALGADMLQSFGRL